MKCYRFVTGLLAFACLWPLAAHAATQRSTEAESVSGGTVVADPDASGQLAMTRNSDGIYTWWSLPSGSVPMGDYTVFVRARSADGNAHGFTDLAVVDGTQIATLSASVGSKAYRWYRLGEFNFAGSALRLSDWSAAGLLIDKVILESVQTANAKDVSGGTTVSDPSAASGSAVTRTSGGIYTWWIPDTKGLPHGSYSVYVRARTQQSTGAATFVENVVVNNSELLSLAMPVNSPSYQWINLGSFDYQGSSLRLADYSSAGLVVDQVRLVQNKPMDPTLTLYHLWYGNVGLSGMLTAEAEAMAGGTVFDDPLASNGQAVSLSSTGIYMWWNVPSASLITGAQYSVDVRMRSMDGAPHSFGLYVTSQNNQLVHQGTNVSSTDYRWYKASGSFVYNGQGLTLSDWSDAGLAVDAARLELISPQSSGYQQIGFYAQGAPGTSGISSDAARLSVLPQDNGQVYGYFRQTKSDNNFNEYASISYDGGATFEVQPVPIISPTTGYNAPGFGSLITAYDGSAYRTPSGYYMVFEGAGDPGARGHPFSSLLAYSADGLHNWTVQGGLVTSPDYNSSASTPNIIQDVESSALYLQWVDVEANAKKSSRHQASLNYLQTWNPQAVWPSAAELWSDPSYGVLTQSPTGSWDSADYDVGSVINEDGYYYMVFMGQNNYDCPAGSFGGLGLARNSQANLASPTQWQKSSLNPLIMTTGSACWMGYPQITKISGNYYLYYNSAEINWTPSSVDFIYRRNIGIPGN